MQAQRFLPGSLKKRYCVQRQKKFRDIFLAIMYNYTRCKSRHKIF